MELKLLADNENALPILANWYFEEWGHLTKGSSLANVTEKLRDYANRGRIPFILLAIEAGNVVGAAQLKYREMDIYPEKEHWLGGVYVSKRHRGNKIAEKIILKIISIGKQLGVHTLHLQTEYLCGGLYSHLGWQPIERVNYHGVDVLVMEKKLAYNKASHNHSTPLALH